MSPSLRLAIAALFLRELQCLLQQTPKMAGGEASTVAAAAAAGDLVLLL